MYQIEKIGTQSLQETIDFKLDNKKTLNFLLITLIAIDGGIYLSNAYQMTFSALKMSGTSRST